MNRPVGVTIIAVLQLLQSLLGLLVGLGILLFKDAFVKAFIQNSQIQQSSQQVPPEALQLGLNIGGGVAILGALIGLLLAYGLFALKGWAWIITLIFSILGILGNLMTAINGQGNRGIAVVQLVINAVIIYYLLRSEVKRAFGR